MTTTADGIALKTPSLSYLDPLKGSVDTFVRERLTETLDAALEVPFDDSSRLVFFSDCHRGDNSRIDAFSRNEALFLWVLEHYYGAGFTYVEVGDGDELYKHRFSEVRRAHARAFDLLHKFDRQDRLHLVVGNHDIQGQREDQVEKEGIVAHAGLLLRHVRTGQQLFVLHGHQVDLMSDRFRGLGRLFVHCIWKPLQLMGVLDPIGQVRYIHKCKTIEQKMIAFLAVQAARIERRVIEWMMVHHQAVICGHTHRPAFARAGAPPYFNTGSCLVPDVMTGLEIQNGEIAMVRWSVRQNGTLRLKREVMAPPRKLRLVD